MKWNALIMCLLILWGCTTTKPAGLINSKSGYRPVDVYVIPLGEVPDVFAKMIADEITKQHPLRAKATNRMSLTDSMFDPHRNQYISNRIADEAKKFAERISDKHKDTFFIVLTYQDINIEDSHLVCNFATHFKGLSVISTARIDLVRNEEPVNEKLKKVRLLKLINKAIGQQVYGYAPSGDIRSVMFSPITCLQDLDKMGSTFTGKEEMVKPDK